MNKTEYFSKAEGWAIDHQASRARSQKVAWTIAGAAIGLAMLEAVALAMLTPLKTVQPITLLVDRQTGHVETVDPLRPKRITADAALLQAYLAQYVTARESFDRATIAADYNRVAIWSSGRARRDYLAQMPASNPASPFNRHPPGTVIAAKVTSVSPISAGTALVRFITQREDLNGGTALEEPWISVVRYRFADAPMSFESRLINPLGFQVTDYRRDHEVPRPLITGQSTSPSGPTIASGAGYGESGRGNAATVSPIQSGIPSNSGAPARVQGRPR